MRYICLDQVILIFRTIFIMKLCLHKLCEGEYVRMYNNNCIPSSNLLSCGTKGTEGF